MRSPLRLAITTLAAAMVVPLSAAAQNTGTKPVPTFTKDVAPILQRSCQKCHRPGQVAPMSLLTYEDARPWARAIKQRVSLREMPPWHIDKTVGIKEYVNDVSLSDEEINTVVRWVDGGALKGNPADMAPPLKFASDEEYAFGTPDFVVKSPEWTVPAQGPDRWPDLYSPSGLTEDRYVRAFTILPSREGKRTVHHVNAYAMQDDSEFRKFADDDQTGDGAGGEKETHIIEYAVGNNGDVFPEDTGYLLKAGAKIHFSIHYHSVGEEVKDSTALGVYFYPKGHVPKHPILSMGPSANLLDILPGANDARHDGFLRLKQPAKLISFQPHMHYRGRAMSLEAIYPDGHRQMLTSVATYDFAWQITYTYKNSPVFPAGTLIHMTSVHDNSTANRHNPDPTNWVGWGRRTIDEMAIAHTDWIFLTEDEYNQAVASKSSSQ